MDLGQVKWLVNLGDSLGDDPANADIVTNRGVCMCCVLLCSVVLTSALMCMYLAVCPCVGPEPRCLLSHPATLEEYASLVCDRGTIDVVPLRYGDVVGVGMCGCCPGCPALQKNPMWHASLICVVDASM